MKTFGKHSAAAGCAGNVFSACSLAFLMLSFPGLMAAETNTTDAGSMLKAWTGEWAFVDDGAGKSPADLNEKPTVEIRLTADGKALEISRKDPTQPDVTELLVPDGTRRPINRTSCSGWRMAALMPEAGMLVSSSEMSCKDTGNFATSNIKVILAADRMVDILALNAAGQKRLAIRKLELERELTSEGNADPPYVITSERLALAEPWSLDTIIHLSETVDTQLLEAALVEKKARLNLTAKSLKELNSANTPKGIIDLVVALAFPDKFHIEKNGQVELRPWLVSSSNSSTVSLPHTPTASYPGYLYSCYSPGGYYAGISYAGLYPGNCWSYYSPFWWDYPVYLPYRPVVVSSGSGGGSSGGSGSSGGGGNGAGNGGRLQASGGYVRITPSSTTRHAVPREGYIPGSTRTSAVSVYSPSGSASAGGGSYSTGGGSGGGSYSGGGGSGSPSASPGGYSSGSGSGGTAVPR